MIMETDCLDEVLAELAAMKARGVRMNGKEEAVARDRRESLLTYRTNGMRITEMADLMRTIAVLDE